VIKRRLAGLVVAVSLLSMVSGCGGLGQTAINLAGTALLKLAIQWATRTRDVSAPASALSATAILHGASPTGGDVSWTIDRDSDPAAYRGAYTAPADKPANVGMWPLEVKFYAAAGAQGALVGTAASTINLNADGNGAPDIAATAVIASVTVPPNQSVTVRKTAQLTFTAHDAMNNIVAVSPGSASWTITAGADKIRLTADGQATGLAEGTASVTAAVDGKTSAAQTVLVIASQVAN